MTTERNPYAPPVVKVAAPVSRSAATKVAELLTLPITLLLWSAASYFALTRVAWAAIILWGVWLVWIVLRVVSSVRLVRWVRAARSEYHALRVQREASGVSAEGDREAQLRTYIERMEDLARAHPVTVAWSRERPPKAQP
jgi:hypothetical protein